MIRVLIVDDEYIMRQGLKYMINWEQEGCEIVGEATNGKEALKMIEALQPHIIICDIVMPLLDGVDFSEAVHQMYPQIQTIILSGYDNFEYVKRTLMSGVVDYILKPALNPEELKRILRKAAKRIPGYVLEKEENAVSYKRIMERFLLGHDKELAVDDFSEIFSEPYFRIYAINIKKENDSGIDMSDILYQKIQRETEKISEVQKLTVMLREELVCVIFCYRGSQNKSVLALIRNLNEQLELLCSGIMGVCSRQFDNLLQILSIYQQEIVKYTDKAFYYQNQKLLMAEEQKEEFFSMTGGKFDFYRYNQLLLGKQYTEAIKLLIQYNEAALRAQTDVYRLKNQIKNMLYHYIDFLQVEEEEKENCRYRYFKKINQAAYLGEYKECISRMAEELQEISGNEKKQNDDRIQQILAYIEKNYREDLKLEDLSDEFNFNYHYLSAYFNQQMKEGFNDYLNRLRVEKACELLKQSNIPISQVSSEVGYSEHSYFCRVFKKITGKTPSSYRRNRNNE